MLFTTHLLVVLAILFFLALFRTFQLGHSNDQKLFEKGTLPPENFNGFAKGTVFPSNFGWKGKTFNSTEHRGINLFMLGNVRREQFPFKTYQTKGLTDTKLDVLAIDYNISENMLPLHFILDELVQIEPNKYLGKLQLKIIPGYPFTLIFFRLEQ